MSTQQDHAQVLIIGGGFSGPVLALALKSRGIPSTIYELRKEGDNQSGNIALAPNALRILDNLGLYDEVRLTGYNYESVHMSNVKGQELGHFMNGSQSKYNYPAIRIHRRDVRNILLARLKSEAIPVSYGKKFSSILEETEDRVTIAFEDGTQATGDYVVGCDGIHSRVRPQVFPDSKPIWSGAFGMMGAVFPDQLTDVLGPLGHQESKHWPVALPRMTFGDGGMFATFPADFAGTEFGFMMVQKAEERTREGWHELEENKDELKAVLDTAFLGKQGHAEYPPEVQMLVRRARPETLSSWPFYIVSETPRWFSSKGRIIFLGDAAHAIPPTGAQGAAMAFEDASTLATTFSRMYRPNPMPDIHTGAPVLSRLDMLNRWCLHRKDRVQHVRDFTTRNGEFMRSTPLYIQQAAKEWAMWAHLKMSGGSGGMEWMYSYHCEDVLAAFAT